MEIKSRNIEVPELITKIRKRILTPVVLIFSCSVGRSQKADTTISSLFQNSCKVIDAMRLHGGIYLDALALGGAGAKSAALERTENQTVGQ